MTVIKATSVVLSDERLLLLIFIYFKLDLIVSHCLCPNPAVTSAEQYFVSCDCEGFECAATSQHLGNQGYSEQTPLA